MPEMTFTVRWPDGTVSACYSPSLVMHDFLRSGETYLLDEFVTRSSAALDIASERVRTKFGFECTSAMQQKAEIHTMAVGFSNETRVEVLSLQPTLEA